MLYLMIFDGCCKYSCLLQGDKTTLFLPQQYVFANVFVFGGTEVRAG